MIGYYDDKNCVVCGRLFTPKSGNAKTCSVHCSRKLQALTRRNNYSYDAELKRGLTVAEQKEKKKHGMDQLTRDAVAAKKHGVSYGRYINIVKNKTKRDAEWDMEFNALKRSIKEAWNDTASSNT